jgi:hypothetical protein
VGDVACLVERCGDILGNCENTSVLTKVARQRLFEEFSVDVLAMRHVQLINRFLDHVDEVGQLATIAISADA